MRFTSFALLVVLTCGRAFAQSGGVENEARRHYEEGSKAFALGEFSRAVSEYRAAYNSKPDPAFLYNIAQAYRLAGDLQQALFFYRSFLSQLPATPNRSEVERRITDLSDQVQRQKQITMTPPNSPVSPAQLQSMPPAAAEPAAAAPATEPTTTAPALVLTQPAPARAEKQPAYKKWWVWTIVGVVAVGAVTTAAVLTTRPAPDARLVGTP